MTDRSGVRGGSDPPLSLPEAQELFALWRGREYGWVRALILLTAAERGEFHADDLADVHLPEPNLIGAAVNALAKGGLLEKLNRHGQLEHRKGVAPAAYSRASYVWRPTKRGKEVARPLWYQRRDATGFWAAARPHLVTQDQQLSL